MGILHKLLKVQPRRELKEFYLFSVFFSFANALILIFEPVFFYKEGISLSTIALYYALHYTLYVWLLPLGGKFASRFGLERSLSVAMPLFVLYFIALATIPYVPNIFWVSWILLTIFKIFYWPAAHAEICKFSEDSNRGTELSWMYAITKGVGVLGPLAGGFIAAIYGFSVLFVIAAGMALLATFPLLRTKERYQVKEFTYASVWAVITAKKHRRMRWMMMGWGENLIDMVYWPVFMFIILGGTGKLGLVASINALIMTGMAFFIGEISDRFSRRQIMRINLPFMILSHLFKPLAGSSLRLMLTDTFSKLSFIGVRLPMWYRLYYQGKSVGALKYAVAFEMILAMAKAVTAWILVVVFMMTLPYTGFVIAFIMAAIMATMYAAL
jgi:MFS family permease